MNDTQLVFHTINKMREDGVIDKYAIGGAIGAAFYTEPTATYDVDVFITFDSDPGSLIVSLEPIYAYLKARGCEVNGEHISIGGWNVQFLPAADALLDEALNEAEETEVGETKVWVMRAEHLMAVALRLGRGKDLIRLEQFVQNKAFDTARLNQILKRHSLVAKWKQFNDKYLAT
jgi:hypothetical protein